ncbi:putative pectinesterase/pectinesterase inhibitor 28 [Momordica charantia]|uniref:Pectinesterase/pectinesterase inhibitor 28 n=1 Tax=Momordica charantia TaxID=3673 RepID=A0A6J1CZ58_MOMCH|nr:putative pectinesterase/pectinesterase inhibitor 28 [Momordica charantia]
MAGTAVVSVLSLILVVGVALAVVAVVNKSSSGLSTENLSPKMKAVATLCSETDYQQECQDTLGKIAQNSTSEDPKEFIKSAIMATVEEVKKGFNLTDTLSVESAGNNSSLVKMSIEDCKDLLQFAVQELQASYSTVGDSDERTQEERVADINTWLSAVISYQQSCLDGLGEADPKLKETMEGGLDAARKLTSNALAIVAGVSQVLGNFGLDSPPWPPPSPAPPPSFHGSRKLPI